MSSVIDDVKERYELCREVIHRLNRAPGVVESEPLECVRALGALADDLWMWCGSLEKSVGFRLNQVLVTRGLVQRAIRRDPEYRGVLEDKYLYELQPNQAVFTLMLREIWTGQVVATPEQFQVVCTRIDLNDQVSALLDDPELELPSVRAKEYLRPLLADVAREYHASIVKQGLLRCLEVLEHLDTADDRDFAMCLRTLHMFRDELMEELEFVGPFIALFFHTLPLKDVAAMREFIAGQEVFFKKILTHGVRKALLTLSEKRADNSISVGILFIAEFLFGEFDAVIPYGEMDEREHLEYCRRVLRTWYDWCVKEEHFAAFLKIFVRMQNYTPIELVDIFTPDEIDRFPDRPPRKKTFIESLRERGFAS